jgi:hypothetical protein
MNRLCLILAGYSVLWIIIHIPTINVFPNQADVLRQWTVSQYAREWIDPYALSVRVLREELGPVDGYQRFVREIPEPENPQTRQMLLSGMRAPEATYPPPFLAWFMITFGGLPDFVLRWLWYAINIFSLFMIGWYLQDYVKDHSLIPCQIGTVRFEGVGFVSVLLFYACSRSLVNSQLIPPLFACLMFACRPGSSMGFSAILFSLALGKPSVSLPFAILLVNQRRWGVLALSAVLQLIAWFGLAWWLSVSPLSLVRDWLTTGAYFMNSPYGIQPLLLALNWVGLPAATLITIAALATLWLLGWLVADASFQKQFAVMGIGSLLWTYHLGYDFLTLLPAFLLLLIPKASVPSLMGLRSFAVVVLMLGLGWSAAVQIDPRLSAESEILPMWFGRVALPLWWLILLKETYVEARRSHVEPSPS